MKKYIIIIVIIVVVAFIGWFALRPGAEPEDLNINQSAVKQEPELKPWEVTLGLYDPAPEPNKLTKLLESRLKELGFKTTILTELVDPEAANQEMTTLLFRLNTQEALAVVIDKVMAKTASYRKGQNDAILQDVIISVWNIDDINWGAFSELASKYNNPDPAEVTVLVINAGAQSRAAAELAELLKEAGYNQAVAENAEETAEEATKPALIYYQRNYKNVAKNLRHFLADQGYTDASYRIQLEQKANIVIVLGPKDAVLQPEAELPIPTIKITN